jgi:DNA-binding NarL/FixJ family response regulator
VDLLQGPEGPTTTLLRRNLKVGSNVATSGNSLQSVWGRLAPWKMEIRTGGATEPYSEFGDIMDDFTNLGELAEVSQKAPVLVIIEQHVLARTCILNILKRELTGIEIVEMATTSGLSWFSGRDIRLIALNIGDKEITDPAIEVSLAFLAEFCPKASVALLSNRDDEATISAAMQRGVRGFFPKSIPVEVAIAGLRLVLAGGVYRPLPIVGQNGASSLISEHLDVPGLSQIQEGNGATRLMPEKAMIDLTPREHHVLEALQLGLPNKLIAVRLNLSENTVKMHIQHIMRKCSARNRTEAVLRWSRRTNGHAPRLRAPSS